MFGVGVPPVGLVVLVLLGFTIATTVNTFAMEAAVLFVPAFLFVFPALVPGFPEIGVNAAIGLALFVELFGYTSSVGAYWYRHQIDFQVALKVVAITVPLAVVGRVLAYLPPKNLLMLSFGGLLVALSVVLYESHEHGPSLTDAVLESPTFGLLDPLPEEYESKTRAMADGGTENGGTPGVFDLELFDKVTMGVGGLLAGLVGIAVGELTQTMLAVRKKMSIRTSTGTSAFVLHVTIVSALVTNILLLTFAPSIAGEGFTVPFGVGAFVAFGCVFGGQMGAYLNSRLPEHVVMKMLMTAYFLVGVFVVVRTVLTGAAH